MGLLDRVVSRARGTFLLRALVTELRLLRAVQEDGVRALERIARALERAAPEEAGAQAFRVGRDVPLDPADLKRETEVSYVDEMEQARLLDIEENLRIVLGREPTETELEREIHR